MWKIFVSLIFTPLLWACAHGQTQIDALTTPSINPEGVWQAVWVKGFDPDWPAFAEEPFDWSQTQLHTNPNDPGNWSRFSGGCQKLWRYTTPVDSNDKDGPRRWGFWRSLHGGCSELVQDGTEFLARSTNLERRISEIIVAAPDYRPDYKIDAEGNMIWKDETGASIARFKPTENQHSCEKIRQKSRMPIECHDISVPD